MIPVKTILLSKNPVYVFPIQLLSTADIAKHYEVEINYIKLDSGQHKLTVRNNPPHNKRDFVYKTEEEAKCKYDELICSLEKQGFVLSKDFNKEENEN